MHHSSNRRCELRISEHATVFLELQAADPFLHQPPTIIICHSIDISANGLQLIIDQPVQVGHIYKLCITPEDSLNPLYLVGEVKWIKKEEHYLIGFEFFESDQTDIDRWKLLIAQKLMQ